MNTQPRKPIQLNSEEIAIITMMRRNSFQEICIQIQDSVIVSVNQIIKYRRKRGGGLVFGRGTYQPPKPGMPLKMSSDETAVISKLRDKPYQQLVILIKNGEVEAINQTLKYKKTGKGYSV